MYNVCICAQQPARARARARAQSEGRPERVDNRAPVEVKIEESS